MQFNQRTVLHKENSDRRSPKVALKTDTQLIRLPSAENGKAPSNTEFDRVLSFFEIYLIASCIFAMVAGISSGISGFW